MSLSRALGHPRLAFACFGSCIFKRGEVETKRLPSALGHEGAIFFQHFGVRIHFFPMAGFGLAV